MPLAHLNQSRRQTRPKTQRPWSRPRGHRAAGVRLTADMFAMSHSRACGPHVYRLSSFSPKLLRVLLPWCNYLYCDGGPLAHINQSCRQTRPKMQRPWSCPRGHSTSQVDTTVLCRRGGDMLPPSRESSISTPALRQKLRIGQTSTIDHN